MLQASTLCFPCCYFTLLTQHYWCWDSSLETEHWHHCLLSWPLWPCCIALLFGSGALLQSWRQQFHCTGRYQPEAPTAHEMQLDVPSGLQGYTPAPKREMIQDYSPLHPTPPHTPPPHHPALKIVVVFFKLDHFFDPRKKQLRWKKIDVS